MAKRRTKSGPAAEVKPLTQEELLAEAAKTELENARSLQVVTITKNPFACRAHKEAPLPSCGTVLRPLQTCIKPLMTGS